jgi:phosphatidylglycerol:prolipoprotein diacylglycerol transferase
MNILAFFQNIFAPPRDLILLILGAWLGLMLSERRATRHRINLDLLSNLLLVGVSGFVLGGRILYILENLASFAQSLSSIFSLNISLFDLWGGLAIAALSALAYGQRSHLPFWSSLDTLTPFFAALAIGVAFSHLAAGTAFGKETNVPWAIEQWGALRHPTQIYEIIASILILTLVLIQRPNPTAGYEFLLFVALTSASRLLIEGFRGDSTLIFGGLRAAQITAWLILCITFIGWEYKKRQKPQKAWRSPAAISKE